MKSKKNSDNTNNNSAKDLDTRIKKAKVTDKQILLDTITQQEEHIRQLQERNKYLTDRVDTLQHYIDTISIEH